MPAVASLEAPFLPAFSETVQPRIRRRSSDFKCLLSPKAETCEMPFVLTDNIEWPKLDRDMVAIACTHDGGVVTDALLRDEGKYVELLAQGLYNLGSLTPAVEAALNIAVSEHEKLEWKLDYEERYGL